MAVDKASQPAEWNSDARAPSWVRFSVLCWLCLAATLAYVHRGCLSVPAKQVQADLNLSDYELGWVFSIFQITYSLFQLPTGWLGDRFGTRVILSACVAVWSAATGAMALAVGFLSLAVMRGVNGAAQAGVFPCSVASIARWFPASRRAFPNGMLGSFMQWGSVVGTALVGFLTDYMDWQHIFVLLSLPGFLWVAGFYWWFRDRPEQHASVSLEELQLIQEGLAPSPGAASRIKAPTPWGTLLTSPQMLLICSQHFFRAYGYVFFLTWFPKYLQVTRGVSVQESGYLSSLPFVGFGVGAMLSGAISDWIQIRTGSRRLSRQGLTIVPLAACAGLVLLSFWIEDPTNAVLAISVGSFFAGVAGAIAYTITIDVGGDHVSTVFSTMNMCGNLGGACSPLVTPWLVEWNGGNWSIALLHYVPVYFAAALCWIFLDPNRPLFREEPPDHDETEPESA